MIPTNNTFKGQPQAHSDNAPTKDTQVCFITDRAGTPLFDFYAKCSDDDAGQKVLAAIEKKGKQDFVRQLENKVSQLNGSLKLTVIRVTGYKLADGREIADRKRVACRSARKSAPQARRTISHPDREPIQRSCLRQYDSLGTSGNIHVVYNSKAKALQPGANIKTGVMSISPPLGLESLKVIGTTTPADFSILTQAGATTRGLDDLSGPKGIRRCNRLSGRQFAKPEIPSFKMLTRSQSTIGPPRG